MQGLGSLGKFVPVVLWVNSLFVPKKEVGSYLKQYFTFEMQLTFFLKEFKADII